MLRVGSIFNVKLSRLIVKLDVRHERAPEASQAFSLSSAVSLGARFWLADRISGLLSQKLENKSTQALRLCSMWVYWNPLALEMMQGVSSDHWRREGGRRLRLGLCSRGKEEEDPAKETGKKWSGKQEDHRETMKSGGPHGDGVLPEVK